MGTKALELWLDGTLIFVARGDHDFLCWGKATKNSGQLIINQLAMIESTYLFVELSKHIYNKTSGSVEEIVYYWGLHNAAKGDHPLRLIPGPINTFDWKFGDNAHWAPDRDILLTIEAKKDAPTGLVAYQILAKVYNWFSIESDRVPYVEEIDGQLMISPEKIKDAGKA